VTLTVDPDAGVVEGDQALRWTPPSDVDRLVFRLWANGPRAGRAGGRLEIVDASVGERAVDLRYESGNAGPGTPGTILVLPGPFEAGRAVEVRITFRLTMPGTVNERVSQAGGALRLGSILPTLAWIRGRGWHTSPAVDAFSESVASEVADYDVTVSAPEGFAVLATGEEVEPGRFVAVAVRDWAATVGPMRLAEGPTAGGRTRIVVGVPEASADDPERLLGIAIGAFDDFASRYGPLPWPTVSVGVSAGLSGGIEFPGHILLGVGTSRDHLVHEVGHMWFYALVGNDQYADPWLDEGLTEYVEALHLGTLASVRGREIPADGRGRVGESHDYWASRTGVFFRSVYVQGAQAMAALADAVGGVDVLDCALRRYVLEHAHQVARPADLVRAVEDQTGVDPRPVLEGFGAL
jgi:hypothetical protein